MKLREQGMPVEILYLGHRDGSTVMVRTDLPATNLRDRRGRGFAIPSKYSNQNLVIHKLMEDQGFEPDEIRFVEMPRRTCPWSLPPGHRAHFIGELHAARAEELNSTAAGARSCAAFRLRSAVQTGNAIQRLSAAVLNYGHVFRNAR